MDFIPDQHPQHDVILVVYADDDACPFHIHNLTSRISHDLYGRSALFTLFN